MQVRGFLVATPMVTDAAASVTVKTLVENDLSVGENARIEVHVLDAAGKEVSTR